MSAHELVTREEDRPVFLPKLAPHLFKGSPKKRRSKRPFRAQRKSKLSRQLDDFSAGNDANHATKTDVVVSRRDANTDRLIDLMIKLMETERRIRKRERSSAASNSARGRESEPKESPRRCARRDCKTNTGRRASGSYAEPGRQT